MPDRPPAGALTPARKARSRTRSALSAIGLLLMIASFVLVGLQLRHQFDAIRELLTLGVLVHLLGCGLFYGASLLIISYSFWLLLRWQGASDLPLAESHRIYGRTLLAKYLPGNIFQILARHVEYRLRGVGDVVLGLAALYEVLGLAAATSCLAIIGLPFLGNLEAQMGLALGCGLVAAACGTLLVPRLAVWIARRRGQPASIEQVTAGRFARVMLLYAFFFIVSGVLAFTLYARVSPEPRGSLSVIFGYALAWLCGFAIPGAAAGLGVREAVMLLILGDTPEALFAALGMRLVTTLGDASLFAGVSLWSRRAGKTDAVESMHRREAQAPVDRERIG